MYNNLKAVLLAMYKLNKGLNNNQVLFFTLILNYLSNLYIFSNVSYIYYDIIV